MNQPTKRNASNFSQPPELVHNSIKPHLSYRTWGVIKSLLPSTDCFLFQSQQPRASALHVSACWRPGKLAGLLKMAVQFVPEESPIKALLDPYFLEGGGIGGCVSLWQKDVWNPEHVRHPDIPQSFHYIPCFTGHWHYMTPNSPLSCHVWNRSFPDPSSRPGICKELQRRICLKPGRCPQMQLETKVFFGAAGVWKFESLFQAPNFHMFSTSS